MDLQGRSRVHAAAWSTPFAFVLAVMTVQIYVLVYFLLAAQHAVGGDFLAYQWFVGTWTGGWTLERGLGFEFMKLNIFLIAYLWAMSRTMHPLRDAWHRWSLLGTALLLLGFQSLWARVPDLARAQFTLVPLDF